MAGEAFVVTPESYPRPLEVVGEQIVVLAAARQTGGYEIFLQRGPEGSGPPPHSHGWDESFIVTKGSVQFGSGEETRVANAGTLVHMPAGTVHWFRFGAGGGEMFSMTSSAGAADLFADIDRAISPGAPDLEKLVEVAARHGLKVPE